MMNQSRKQGVLQIGTLTFVACLCYIQELVALRHFAFVHVDKPIQDMLRHSSGNGSLLPYV